MFPKFLYVKNCLHICWYLKNSLAGYRILTSHFQSLSGHCGLAWMLTLKGIVSNSFAFVNILSFCLETTRNLPLKSNSFTRICLRVNHSGLIFPGTQGAISMCRFRCFSISGEILWITILIILTLFHFSSLCIPIMWILLLLCQPFYYFSFFMSFSISCLFYHPPSMPLIKFSLESILPRALAIY